MLNNFTLVLVREFWNFKTGTALEVGTIQGGCCLDFAASADMLELNKRLLVMNCLEINVLLYKLDDDLDNKVTKGTMRM
jgi:hypothetical protein